MANEITKVTDQNGVDHPFKDVAAFPRSEQAVLGAVNLFNNTATTDTVGGIECTINADKTVTASGTYSGGTYVQFSLGRISVKAGQILKGCPSGGSTSTYQLILFNSAQSARLATDLGEGAVISADDSNALLAIYFHASVTDKVFKPQICLSMDTPYAPYAMTNRELTDAVVLKDATSDITRNTEQTAYSISSLFVYKIGRLVTVIGDISSLTENAVPSGRAFTTIATGLPKALKGSNMFTMPIGSGNQTQVYVEGNTSDMKMRGGTTGQSYQFVFTYISAS